MGKSTNSGQRRHESPEVGAMVRRMVRALVRRAAEGDWEAIEQLAMLEREVPVATSCALALSNAPKDDAPSYSFSELATVLGTSRQATRQRATRVDPDSITAAYYSDGASTRLDWSR